MYTLTINLDVPTKLENIAADKGANMSQETSVNFNVNESIIANKDDPIIKELIKRTSHDKWYQINVRVSPLIMHLNGQSKKVPFLFYDNTTDKTYISFTIRNNNNNNILKHKFEYSLKEKDYPKIIPNKEDWIYIDENTSKLNVDVSEVIDEKWEYFGRPLKPQIIYSNNYAIKLNIRLAVNVEKKRPLLAFVDRVYALESFSLFIKDDLLEKRNNDIVLGKDINEYCEKNNHPKPPEHSVIIDNGCYVPVDKDMLCGTPLLNDKGNMVGMVMLPGWARFFSKEEKDKISPHLK